MDSILRRGNPHEKTREKTRENTRVKPREKALTRVAIGKFWVRGNNVNNAARARPGPGRETPARYSADENSVALFKFLQTLQTTDCTIVFFSV